MVQPAASLPIILWKSLEKLLKVMKNSRGIIPQFIKFSLVGGICFLFEYGLFALLNDVMGIEILIANALAFLASTVLNYILSMRFVFIAREDSSRARLFIIYVILSIVGLGINEAIVWIGVEVLSINKYVAKLIATVVVLVYNFITRKVFIEKN